MTLITRILSLKRRLIRGSRVIRGYSPPRHPFTTAIAVMMAVAVVFAQDQAPNRRDVAIVARDHQFSPNRIEVTQDDLVRVTVASEDRLYSFAVDAYRIVKRVAAGQKTVFEFRAHQPGTFTFYCNLTSDAACKDMRGTLVVNPK